MTVVSTAIEWVQLFCCNCYYNTKVAYITLPKAVLNIVKTFAVYSLLKHVAMWNIYYSSQVKK